MKAGFYPKLAAGNIKKNGKTYIPYILTCILTVAMFYMIRSLTINPGLKEMKGGEMVASILAFGSCVIASFAAIFLFYTNSFLVKRRKKEFAVFNILGMEKRHLFLVLAWESVYVLLISLTVGLLIGIALDKAMFLLITRLMGADIVLGFFISAETVISTVGLFAGVSALILLNAVRQIQVSNPVELLQAGNAGEKEPKTKWLMAVLGFVCIGIGYYIAITTEDPLAVITLFFIAVMLVIAGTYMLFTAGSIALLKLMRKNKGYYYRTKHFISISGMIYRMKQNAAGLANICILSTMVLVMVSSTTSLMVGLEDVIQNRYPNDIALYFYESATDADKALEAACRLREEKKLNVTDEIQYEYLEFTARQDGDAFKIGRGDSASSFSILFFVTLDDYNAASGERRTLHDGEVLVHSNYGHFNKDIFSLFGKEYQVAEKLGQFIGNGGTASMAVNTVNIVLPSRQDLEWIYQKQLEEAGDSADMVKRYYGFDTDASPDEQVGYYKELKAKLEPVKFKGYVESKEDAKLDLIGMYGGLFFIGVFLGSLFVMATVLIIYYKQISEGYDDKERFAIMQKVGMGHHEVKASIRSQVLTVFFLPLAVAGIHVMAAFPLIARMLRLLGLLNTKLYIICTGVSFLIFAAMYVFIYTMTARTYYRIVSR